MQLMLKEKPKLEFRRYIKPKIYLKSLKLNLPFGLISRNFRSRFTGRSKTHLTVPVRVLVGFPGSI